MKVGFDGRYAEGDLVGVGNYILNLIKLLAQKDIKCVIFYSKQPKYSISGKNISQKILSSNNSYIFEQINLPKALIQEKVSIYHATGNMGIPLFCPVPAVLTVHDIIPLLINDYFKHSRFGLISKFSYLFRLKTSLFKAQKIITDSEFTKKSLKEKFNLDNKKIKSIYLGVSKINLRSSELPKGIKSKKYILNNGGIDSRKNLDILIKSFAKVVREFPDYKLVITGKNEEMKKELENLAISLKIEKAVVFTGYIEEDNLISLIEQAICICYPSLFEGFGLPILEGFNAGVPVITSNISSLSEVAGDAAYLINPNDENEISKGIIKIIKDANLRKQLIVKGKERVKQFSWEKMAQEVIEIYEEIIA